MAVLLLGLTGCGTPSTPSDGLTGERDPASGTSQPPVAPVGIWLDEDPALRGYPALAEAVAALGNNIRVLHTGAHPDDENSDLLAYLARGRHFRTAYLSATRGEGGQNGIGPETGAALGVIRTEELLAARRIDGAEQYFLSKPDFGFSKTAAETLKVWGHDETLNELVHFIRWYRPHVVVSAFSGTPHDGHGHHQAIGQLTREAFDKAADPAYVAGQPAWKTQILYQSLWRDPGEKELPGQRFTIDVGQYNPLFGKTYHQLAMTGRSQHRSQDMGAAQDPGPHPINLRLWAVAQGALTPHVDLDPFARVWPPFTPVTSEDGPQGSFPQEPSVAQAKLAQEAFARGDHSAMRIALVNGHEAALRGRSAVEKHLAAVSRQVVGPDPLLEAIGEFAESAKCFERALHLAASALVEVRCDQNFLVPGQTATLTVRLIPRGSSIALEGIDFDHAADWHFEKVNANHAVPFGDGLSFPFTYPANGEGSTVTYRFTVPSDAAYTQPTYHRMAWADASRYGNHHQATMDLPPIVAHINYRVVWSSPQKLGILGTVQAMKFARIRADASAQYVWTDPRFGERREMVKVVPPVIATVEPSLIAVPRQISAPRWVKLGVTMQNLSFQDRICGFGLRDALTLAHDSMAPFQRKLTAQEGQYQARIDRKFLPPTNLQTVRLKLDSLPVPPDGAAASLPQDKNFPGGCQRIRIDHPHIRAHHLFPPAEYRFFAVDAALPDALKVGYISGPGTDGDLIDALKQLGADVTVLDDDLLRRADLKTFDTIFAGVRAYEVRPDLVAANPKLLDWVKAGGTLVVLYQKYPFAKQDCAPAPFQFAQPHDRVTEEDAPVTLLQPDHRLLTWPNKITADDFSGWRQDRGLYFFAEAGRDPGYTALLSCHDENEPAKTGGLLDFSLGKGRWVYCAYALHLQIPEAVPGAWRILANLAAYGRPPAK